VTKKECGSSAVLGCRYHGWSYDTKGKLIKAPEFEGIEGFEKSENGLWEVRLRLEKGLVFVNLDSGEIQDCGDSQRETRLGVPGWDLKALECRMEWGIDVQCNWKLLGLYSRPF
jgi:phenylpropionate dioxygenase-like ring-hydroxylating dioxygenase large terminal subunit